MRVPPTPCALALALLLAAGCATPPGPTRAPEPPGRTAAPNARTSPAATPSPSPTAVTGLAGTVRAPLGILAAAGILSNNGGNIISDNGGGIISDNGGGILSNNGGSVVANNGARYAAGGARRGLLAIDQAPAAGVVVRVTDASGTAQAGPDGRPLEARTDAAGRYRFPGLTPGRNLIVVAELPQGQGAVRAVASRAQDGPVDLDLASTLTTGYIQDRYLAGIADPNATFERLTPEVERETRVRAAAALARAGDAAPARLTNDAVRTAVDALRARDAGLDAQLERVRRLLLVAGVADLGAGKDARTVVLGLVDAVLPLPDGTLAIASPRDHRVWRVDREGVLRTLVGTGRPDPAAPRDGLAAADVPLATPTALALDASGRLLVAEDGGVLRLEPDGTVRAFPRMKDGAFAALAAGRTPDEALVLVRGRREATPTWEGLLSVVAVGGPAPGPLAPPAPGFWLPTAAEQAGDAWYELTTVAARAADGTLQVLEAPVFKDLEDEDYLAPAAPVAHAIDLATGARREPAPVEGARIALSPDGTWFSRLADGTLVATPAAGAPVRYAPAQLAGLPAALRAAIDGDADYFPLADAFAWAGGGRTLVSDDEQVWELGPGGAVRHVAGVPTAGDRTGEAAAVELDDPLGAALDAAGGLVLVDGETRRLLRRDPAGRVTPLAGRVAEGGLVVTSRDGGYYIAAPEADEPTIDFGAAYAAAGAQASFAYPAVVRAAGPDVLVLDDGRFVRRVAPDGAVSTAFVVPAAERALDLAVAPDGAIWYLVIPDDRAPAGTKAAAMRRAPDGTTAAVGTLPDPPGYLALQPDGTPWVVAGDTLYRRAGDAWQAVAADERLALVVDEDVDDATARLAVDAAGRAYFAAGDVVLRLRPGATAWDVLAGPKGRLLTGSRPDDGLGDAAALALDATGGLYVVDREFDAVRRLAPEDLDR